MPIKHFKERIFVLELIAKQQTVGVFVRLISIGNRDVENEIFTVPRISC
jgi:hypothetical protein